MLADTQELNYIYKFDDTWRWFTFVNMNTVNFATGMTKDSMFDHQEHYEKTAMEMIGAWLPLTGSLILWQDATSENRIYGWIDNKE